MKMQQVSRGTPGTSAVRRVENAPSTGRRGSLRWGVRRRWRSWATNACTPCAAAVVTWSIARWGSTRETSAGVLRVRRRNVFVAPFWPSQQVGDPLLLRTKHVCVFLSVNHFALRAGSNLIGVMVHLSSSYPRPSTPTRFMGIQWLRASYRHASLYWKPFCLCERSVNLSEWAVSSNTTALSSTLLNVEINYILRWSRWHPPSCLLGRFDFLLL